MIDVSFWDKNQRVTVTADSVRYDASGQAWFTVTVAGQSKELSSQQVSVA